MVDFDDWYEREHPRVLAACRALGGDVDAAAEATSEAFVRAAQRWASVRTMAAPGGWVQVVALNQLRRSLHRRQVERRILPRRGEGVEGPPPPDVDLWRAVAALPERQQRCVVLRYVHDLPEAEIAALLGIARGTVASTLSAAREGLRVRLSQKGHDDDRDGEHIHG